MKYRLIEALHEKALTSDELKAMFDYDHRIDKLLQELVSESTIVLGDDWCYYLV